MGEGSMTFRSANPPTEIQIGLRAADDHVLEQ
jgi:hypothetical protein